MARRYGRNQKRAAREAIAAAERKTAYWEERHRDDAATMARRERQLQEEITAARRARDTIKVDVDVMLDAKRLEASIQAHFTLEPSQRPVGRGSALRAAGALGSVPATTAYATKRAVEFHAALDVDVVRDLRRRNAIEAGAFLDHAGRIIAERALLTLLRKGVLR